MKLAYYRDTDSLYIDLSEHASSESREICEGIVLDYETGTWSGSTLTTPAARSSSDGWYSPG